MKEGKVKSKAYYRKKADVLLQKLVHKLYTKCMVCGGVLSCGHHYFPKSMAGNLRYDMENIIPLCVKCHFTHHNGNPSIHARVLELKGNDWHNLLRIRKDRFMVHDTIAYYREVIQLLKTKLEE